MADDDRVPADTRRQYRLKLEVSLGHGRTFTVDYSTVDQVVSFAGPSYPQDVKVAAAIVELVSRVFRHGVGALDGDG